MNPRFLIPALLSLCVLSVPLHAAETPAPTKVVLENGATLIVQPDPGVENVAIYCFVRAGVAEEEGISGLAALTARAAFGSNDNQSRDAVSRDIYLAGGSLEAFWEHDYTLFSCVTTRAAFRDAMYTLGQALKTAQFDPESVEAARKFVTADLVASNTDPFRKAYDIARSRLYSDGPYRIPLGGTAENLLRVPAAGVQAFYRKRYTPSATVISIAGNVTVEEARRSAGNQLVDFSRPAARPARRENGPPPAEPARVTRKMPIHTRLVVAGYRGPGVTDPDYPAWLTLNALVGGGKSSRLFRSVRDVSGVGYTVISRPATLARDGNLMAAVEYDPARTGADGKPIEAETVVTMVLDAVRSILDSPPSDSEVGRAKRFAAGRVALAHERVRDRAFHLGWYEAIGAGYAFDSELPKRILATTPDDVLRLARKWLKNEVVVVIDPER